MMMMMMMMMMVMIMMVMMVMVMMMKKRKKEKKKNQMKEYKIEDDDDEEAAGTCRTLSTWVEGVVWREARREKSEVWMNWVSTLGSTVDSRWAVHAMPSATLDWSGSSRDICVHLYLTLSGNSCPASLSFVVCASLK